MRWLVILFVLALSSQALAATYYVDDDGNQTAGCKNATGCCTTDGDTTTCGATKPCSSYAKLKTDVGTFAAGDTINFCQGNYRETSGSMVLSQSGSSGSPITFQRDSSALSWAIGGALTSIVDSGTTATVTTTTDHTLSVGRFVTIRGATVDADLNATYEVVTVPTSKTFTIFTANTVTDATYTDSGMTLYADAAIVGTDLCSTWTLSATAGVYYCSFTPVQLQTGATTDIRTLSYDGKPIAEHQATDCPALSVLTTQGFCTNRPAVSCTQNSDCSGQWFGGGCDVEDWCYDSAASRVYLHTTGGADPTSHLVEVGSRYQAMDIHNRSWITIGGSTAAKGLTFVGQQGGARGNGSHDESIYTSSCDGGTNVLKYNNFGFQQGTVYLPTGCQVDIEYNQVTDGGQGSTYHTVDSGSNFVFRIQNFVTSATIANNILRRVGYNNWLRSAPAGTNCGYSNSSTATAGCWLTTCDIQSGAGIVHVDDNTMIDVEKSADLKVTSCSGSANTISSGSSISRNTFRAWSHPATLSAYSAAYGIGVMCANCGGGPVDCETLAPAPVVHQMQVANNKISGFAMGILADFGPSLSAGDSYTVLYYNNFVHGSLGRTTNTTAALTVGNQSGNSQTAGQLFYNNTFQCDTNPLNNQGLWISSKAQAPDFKNNIFDFANCPAGRKISNNSATATFSNNVCDVASAGVCATGANTLSYTSEPTDLHLTSDPTSVVIDQGASISYFTTDIDAEARPHGGAWDIGADEAIGLPPGPTPTPTSSPTPVPTPSPTPTAGPTPTPSPTPTPTPVPTATPTPTPSPVPTASPVPGYVPCGNQVNGGGASGFWQNSVAGVTCVPAVNSTVASVVVNVATAGSGSPSLRCGVYDNAADPNKAKLCETAAQAVVAGMNTLPIAACPTLTAGTTYSAACNNNGTAALTYADASNATTQSTCDPAVSVGCAACTRYTVATFQSLPDPWGATSRDNCQPEIFLNLVPVTTTTAIKGGSVKGGSIN